MSVRVEREVRVERDESPYVAISKDSHFWIFVHSTHRYLSVRVTRDELREIAAKAEGALASPEERVGE